MAVFDKAWGVVKSKAKLPPDTVHSSGRIDPDDPNQWEPLAARPKSKPTPGHLSLIDRTRRLGAFQPRGKDPDSEDRTTIA